MVELLITPCSTAEFGFAFTRRFNGFLEVLPDLENAAPSAKVAFFRPLLAFKVSI